MYRGESEAIKMDTLNKVLEELRAIPNDILIQKSESVEKILEGQVYEDDFFHVFLDTEVIITTKEIIYTSSIYDYMKDNENLDNSNYVFAA